MEKLLLKHAMRFGIPGVAIFIFYALYNKFQIQIEALPSNLRFIVIMTFMIIVAIVTVLVIFITKEKAGFVGHKYEELKKGLATPKQNVLLIEQIANSNDPHKIVYLENFISFENISTLELKAVDLVLGSLRKNKGAKISNIYETVISKEKNYLVKNSKVTDDPLIDTVIASLKYWEFINRRNHPQFSEVQTAIANALSYQNPEQIVDILTKVNYET